MNEKFIIILTTFPDEKEADSITSELVEQGLCLCAQIFPIKSVYKWKGNIENSKELLCFLKTSASNFEKVRDFVLEHHSYEVPEIISIPIDKISPSYLKWLSN